MNFVAEKGPVRLMAKKGGVSVGTSYQSLRRVVAIRRLECLVARRVQLFDY